MISAVIFALPLGHLVHLEPLQISDWGLPPSVNSKYKIYSFEEAKDLRVALEQVPFLIQQNALLTEDLELKEVLISSTKAHLFALKEINETLVKQSDRRMTALVTCAAALEDVENSTFPVVALSVSGAVFVTGVIMIALATPP